MIVDLWYSLIVIMKMKLELFRLLHQVKKLNLPLRLDGWPVGDIYCIGEIGHFGERLTKVLALQSKYFHFLTELNKYWDKIK